jgi:hypothetical protein
VFVKAEHFVKVFSTSNGEAKKPDCIFVSILVGTNKILLAARFRKPKGWVLRYFHG